MASVCCMLNDLINSGPSGPLLRMSKAFEKAEYLDKNFMVIFYSRDILTLRKRGHCSVLLEIFDAISEDPLTFKSLSLGQISPISYKVSGVAT